jgi:hypothetical protein
MLSKQSHKRTEEFTIRIKERKKSASEYKNGRTHHQNTKTEELTIRI